MKDILLRIKERLSDKMSGEEGGEEKDAEEYVELGPEAAEIEEGKAKIVVRPFVVEDFDDIKVILDVLREGYTIALVNIKPLKDKDLIELKRAINKLKKTADAIDGDIAGFGEDYIVATPSFASVYRSQQTGEVSEEPPAE
ncbi:cell division protein SepF [Candidatus Woesearchaeota archaeon]|nr:cell division protein SepF [Candidatus Woesearchaeota archaeon]